MRTAVVILLGALLLPVAPLVAQELPPVEACRPGDFTIIGWPNELGPQRDAKFDVLIDKGFDGGFLTTEPIWVPVIERSVQKWNTVSGATWRYRLEGLTSEEASPFDGKVTIAPCGGGLFACPAGPPPSIPPGPKPPKFEPDPYGPAAGAHATVIAVTLVSAEGVDQAIKNSDIFFNPALPLSPDPGGNEIDFESVLIHELGHALGIDHNDNCVVGPTVMESLIGLGDRRRELSQSEVEAVKYLYPGDGTAAVRLFEKDTSLRFDAIQGALSPAGQTAQIFGKGGGRWVATATTNGGGNWLRLKSQAGRFPFEGNLTISVESGALAAGDYTGTVSVNLEGHSGPAAAIAVVLHVAEEIRFHDQPLLTGEGITSSANLTSQRLAPGALFTLFGRFLAAATDQARSVPLPTRLGGSEVLVNGIPAPLLYVSPTQINGQVPIEAGLGRGGIVVRTGVGQTRPIPVDLHERAVEIFQLASGQSLVLNADNTMNTPQNPADAGTNVSVYLSGQGSVSPPVASGRAAPLSPLAWVPAISTATIGGQNAEVLFLGLAPGFVGLGQAVLRVPAGVSGNLELQIRTGDVASNVGQISVR